MISIVGINSLSRNLGPEPLILPWMKLMTQMKSTFTPAMQYFPLHAQEEAQLYDEQQQNNDEDEDDQPNSKKSSKVVNYY